MADNITVTQGTGTTMATDDVSGVQYPRIKISIGADGSATDVSSANPLPISDNSGSLTVDGTVTANLGTLNGASTAANQTTIIGHLDGVEGLLTTSNTNTSSINNGFSNVEFVRNDYTGVNVTTSAYTQLIASTANDYKEVEIFDSSGQTLKLAFGAASSEVDKILIFAGGNGRVRLAVPSSTRISIKAVSATASAGEISINFYG